MLHQSANHDIESLQPDRLEASIGNGHDGYFHVEGDGITLIYHQPGQSPEDSGTTLHPRPEQWVAFWQDLADLDVWNWNRRTYGNPDVIDGTYWSLTATHQELRLETSGANGYPDSTDPSPGPTFNALCAAISRLANDKPFQ